MPFVATCIVTAILVIGLISYRKYGIERMSFVVSESVFFGLVIGIMIGFLGSIVMLPFASTETIEHHKTITSLSRDSQIDGTFVLGTGNVDSQPVYYFYAEKDGGQILETTDALNVVLHEEDRIDGDLVTYSCRYTDLQFFFYRLDFMCSTGDRGPDMYVPNGTIQEAFEV